MTTQQKGRGASEASVKIKARKPPCLFRSSHQQGIEHSHYLPLTYPDCRVEPFIYTLNFFTVLTASFFRDTDNVNQASTPSKTYSTQLLHQSINTHHAFLPPHISRRPAGPILRLTHAREHSRLPSLRPGLFKGDRQQYRRTAVLRHREQQASLRALPLVRRLRRRHRRRHRVSHGLQVRRRRRIGGQLEDVRPFVDGTL